MRNTQKLAAGLCAAAVVAVPTVATGPAHAAGRNWTAVQHLSGGTLQLCKQSANGGRSWTVYNRLNGTRATSRLEAKTVVTVHGQETKHSWHSGWVQSHTISPVGTVVVARKPGRGLVVSIDTGAMGNGGTLTLSAVGRC